MPAFVASFEIPVGGANAAICVIGRRPVDVGSHDGQWVQHFDIRYVESFGRRGLLDVANAVKATLTSPPLDGDAVLVVDTANVGLPFRRMLAGLRYVAIAIDSQTDGKTRAPLHAIQSSAALSMQEGRLKHAAGMSTAAQIASALRDIADTTREVTSSLGRAIGLGAWWARRSANGCPWVSDYPPRPYSPEYFALQEYERNVGGGKGPRDERDLWDGEHHGLE